jgi:hypothetical protein
MKVSRHEANGCFEKSINCKTAFSEIPKADAPGQFFKAVIKTSNAVDFRVIYDRVVFRYTKSQTQAHRYC